MKTRLEKQLIKEIESCQPNPKKETLDIIHNIVIMHIVKVFLSVLISTSLALFIDYAMIPAFMEHSYLNILLFVITNLLTLCAICMDDTCIKILHPTDLTGNLTYDTFINHQVKDYLYIPVCATIVCIMVIPVLSNSYEEIVHAMIHIYNIITSDTIVQISMIVIGSICIGLYKYYKYNKKQDILPFIQNDNITCIQWNGQSFWVTHKEKGKYNIPEIALSNEASETILGNMANMVDVPFDEHTPCLTIKIDNLIIYACHKTMSPDNMTTFVIEKQEE